MNTREREGLLDTLKTRFEKHKKRHTGIEWPEVLARLNAKPEKIQSLFEMEKTGGEPDVIGHNSKTGEVMFADCSAESPTGRRSLCYDKEALDSRKENKPSGSVVAMAESMGISLMSEAEYRTLQALGNFDTKTSSWIETPKEIRGLGGSLFCDRRYNTVFVYHNGAQSYYAARGFRGVLKV